VQDGQQECGGLAATGHGAGQEVAAGHRGRYRVGLDGGRFGEAEVVDAAEEIGVKLQTAERHGGPLLE